MKVFGRDAHCLSEGGQLLVEAQFVVVGQRQQSGGTITTEGRAVHEGQRRRSKIGEPANGGRRPRRERRGAHHVLEGGRRADDVAFGDRNVAALAEQVSTQQCPGGLLEEQ